MFISLLVLASAATAENVDLKQIIDGVASLYNVSISAAITTEGGKLIAAAAGAADRSTGEKATPQSLYPAGSVTKTFTAVAAMRLHEQGKLDLDAPFHTIVDPWLLRQGEKKMVDLWEGDVTIEAVTVRHLLSMRSGIRDYDDYLVKAYTIDRPHSDYLPWMYVANVTKTFLFPPGKGGAYTGVGYVLLGWVLCASVDSCHTWDQLDQAALVTTPSYTPSGLVFMRKGPCSQYKGVVHQYTYAPGAAAPGTQQQWQQQQWQQWQRLVEEPLVDVMPQPPSAVASHEESMAPLSHTSRHATEVALMSRGDAIIGSAAPSPPHCTHPKVGKSGNWYPGVTYKGSPAAVRNVSSGGAAACCAVGDTVKGAFLWSFVPLATDTGTGVGADASAGAGTCKLYTEYKGYVPDAEATSGRTDPMVSEDDFVDIYDASCLNGWTMGNIAISPSAATSFYHALFFGKIVSEASLAQMLHFQPLTTGFSPGTPYGLGMMAQEFRLPIVGVKNCSTVPAAQRGACKCIGVWVFKKCYYKISVASHAGLDYGSGMALIGAMKDLNVTYALATNTGESPMGMNSTMTVSENSQMLYLIFCNFIVTAIRAQVPGFPALSCY